MDRAVFLAALKRGRRINRASCAVVSSPAEHRRLAIVVPKKVAAGAVARNALRRALYALLRVHAPQDRDTIVLLKPAARTIAKRQLLLEVEEALAEVVSHPKAR